jgi:cytosine deaminase
MDNYYVSKLIPLIAESGVHVIANPLINITLQGRHDTYPKRRGMTRVPELMAGGVNVAFGHDCVHGPLVRLGTGDMLEVAHMGLHVAQITSVKGNLPASPVPVNAAKVMGFEGYVNQVGAKRTSSAAGAGCGGRFAASGAALAVLAARAACRSGASSTA